MDIVNLKLISLDDAVRLPHESTCCVVVFECEGPLAKFVYTRTPSTNIAAIIKQAAPWREIWIVKPHGHYRSSQAAAHFLRDQFIDQHVRNGYFRVPLNAIDAALTDYFRAQDERLAA